MPLRLRRSKRITRSIAGFTQDEAIDTPEEFKTVLSGRMPEIHGRILIKEFPAKTATISQIKAHARHAIRKLGLNPKMIVIDYAETVRADNTDRNRPEHRLSADVYVQARAMGQELKCCILMPDRCKMETVERAVPSMTSFQGAFEKAGVVDIGIGLCQTEEENLNGRIRFFVFLNRHGRAGVLFEGTVDAERYRITGDKEVPYNPPTADEEADAAAAQIKKYRNKNGKRVKQALPVNNPDFS
jgi:hypothetical protein